VETERTTSPVVSSDRPTVRHASPGPLPPRRGRLRRGGQALVELALLLPILLLLAAGGGDFARSLALKTDIVNSSREGARAASLPGPTNGDPLQHSNPNCADWVIWNAAVTESPGLNWPTVSTCDESRSTWTAPNPTSSQCSLTIAPSQSSRRGSGGAEYGQKDVKVTVVCPFNAITPLLGMVIGNAQIRGVAVARTDY